MAINIFTQFNSQMYIINHQTAFISILSVCHFQTNIKAHCPTEFNKNVNKTSLIVLICSPKPPIWLNETSPGSSTDML